MATRLWTALLMLAAVFAMHGLQCTSAADTPHASGAVHAASGAVHAASAAVHAASAAVHAASDVPAAPAADDSHPAGGPTAAMAVAHTGTAPGAGDHAVADAAAADGPAAVSDAGHGSAPHEAAGHLGTLCLAVLAAGIAVLLALLVPRLVGLASPALRRVRGRTCRWLTLLRPPDLFSLCLLRI
jgi:hypothetical protein